MAKYQLSRAHKPPQPSISPAGNGTRLPDKAQWEAEAESSKSRLAEEARAALGHAQAILAKMPDPKAGRPWGERWFAADNFLDWLHARFLTREAEALLDMKEEKKQQKDTKDTK